MGICVLLIIIISFTTGLVRQEPALALAGAAFFLPWLYCLIMTLLLALLHRRRARRAFIRISPREVSVGGLIEAVYCEGDTGAVTGKISIFQFPGILVRCRLKLAARDGRRISHELNPADSSPAAGTFPAEKRGAYFSGGSEFAVSDILGFFRCAFRLKPEQAAAENDALLLVSPRPASEARTVNARAGDSSLKPEFTFQRTDNFIDHRPYVPGDDPRRINWKLYGHGSGLFVREGEREPPPHANLMILVDTEYDPLLYSVSAARRGIDALCENALAAALACTGSGIDVTIGSSEHRTEGSRTGRGERESRELSTALAWPAALPFSAENSLPPAPNDRGILIFALPRTVDGSALDRFLGNAAERSAGRTSIIELLFHCGSEADGSFPERLAAAETCAALYNRRSGVRAKVIR
jgi:uncharacterized protein (DUF58 family)